MNISKSSTAFGFTLAIIGSISYGLNPLFALPLYGIGISPMNVLFYRYILSVILMFIWMLLKGDSFRITGKELAVTAFMGILFAISSVCLFVSFKYMNAGLASVILFTYPMFVALLSWIFLHEHMEKVTLLCIVVAFVGICMLDQSGKSSTGNMSLLGMSLAVASGFTYAFYLIGVNHSVLKTMPSSLISFYALLSGTIMLFIVNMCTGGIVILPTAEAWGNALGLGFFPTLLSIVVVTRAIHIIGSTPASLMGAFEPVTALLVTLLVFGGYLTVTNVIGIVLVLGAVLLMIAAKKKDRV